jgi:hypothetical protein
MVREFSIPVTDPAGVFVDPANLIAEPAGLVAGPASAWWTLMTQR